MILSEESLDKCAMEMLDKADDCPKAQAAMKACGDKYDEEENKRIMDVFYTTAHIECFMQKDKIMKKAMESMATATMGK